MDKIEALALIKRCEEIRDGKAPACHYPYLPGQARDSIDAQIEELKERVKKHESKN